jgi:predicted RNase H-like HicB family nuclease
MAFEMQFELEADDRWIAEIGELPGVMVYGATQEEAKSKVEALALGVLSDWIESESLDVCNISFCMT